MADDQNGFCRQYPDSITGGQVPIAENKVEELKQKCKVFRDVWHTKHWNENK